MKWLSRTVAIVAAPSTVSTAMTAGQCKRWYPIARAWCAVRQNTTSPALATSALVICHGTPAAARPTTSGGPARQVARTRTSDTIVIANSILLPA